MRYSDDIIVFAETQELISEYEQKIKHILAEKNLEINCKKEYRTNPNEPWEFLFDEYERGDRVDYDFTKWQHDLFRPNLRPYDPREIKVLEKFNNLAKKEGR